MKLLTLEEIIEINIEVGEKGTLINRANLAFIISRIEEAKNIDEAASILFYDIINMHPFLDGNKRTAYVSMKTFMEMNGKHIKLISKEEMEKLIYQIANNKYNLSKVKKLIKEMLI